MQIRIAVLTVVALSSTAVLGEEKQSKIEQNSAYDKMKTLLGSWKGSVEEGGRKIPVKARAKMISDNSVLAHWLDEGSPSEMVTMFHMNGAKLMATHYCAAHNQPRLILQPGSDPNRLVFKFKDGTNIQPGAAHMQQIAFIFNGSNHHIEEWTSIQNGKEETTRFDFKRKQ